MAPKFSEVVDQAAALVEQRQRVSTRALRREFNLDDETLDDLIHELVDVLQLARKQSNDILVAATATLPPSDATASQSETPQSEVERRQITVVFCDLVGSTAISKRLDPEDLSDLFDNYRRAAAQAVAEFDGHVAQYLGDGIMVYFGWPTAHEDDATRAVKASLSLIERVAENPRA